MSIARWQQSAVRELLNQHMVEYIQGGLFTSYQECIAHSLQIARRFDGIPTERAVPSKYTRRIELARRAELPLVPYYTTSAGNTLLRIAKLDDMTGAAVLGSEAVVGSALSNQPTLRPAQCFSERQMGLLVSHLVDLADVDFKLIP